MTVAVLVYAEYAVRLVVVGQVPLSSAIVAEQEDAVTRLVRERQIASLIEPCGRADGVGVGNLVVAVPHVGDAGPFSDGPLAGSRTKAGLSFRDTFWCDIHGAGGDQSSVNLAGSVGSVL